MESGVSKALQFTSKELQGEPRPECRPLSVGLYLQPFKHHVRFLSSVLSSKTSHALFPGSVQKNTMCLLQQNILL